MLFVAVVVKIASGMTQKPAPITSVVDPPAPTAPTVVLDPQGSLANSLNRAGESEGCSPGLVTVRQFDECGLTLREIGEIRESLIKSLIGIYHGRIKYPEQRTA